MPGAKLKETLDLDSLDYIDLAVVIENNFGFKVKPEDFTGIITSRIFMIMLSAVLMQKNSHNAFLAG